MHCILCTLIYEFYSIQCILYSVHWSHCIVLYDLYYMHGIIWMKFQALYSIYYILCFQFHTSYFMYCILCISFYAFSYHSLKYKQLVLVKGRVNKCQVRGTALCISDQTSFLWANKSPDVVWEGKPNEFPNHTFFVQRIGIHIESRLHCFTPL